MIEARSGQFEYCRVLADFSSREENALPLSAGEIVAVVPKDDPYTQRGKGGDVRNISTWQSLTGWLYGIKDGEYGLFPADYVDKLSPRSIRKEIKSISKITQSSSARR